jgi:hypothetical protein
MPSGSTIPYHLTSHLGAIKKSHCGFLLVDITPHRGQDNQPPLPWPETSEDLGLKRPSVVSRLELQPRWRSFERSSMWIRTDGPRYKLRAIHGQPNSREVWVATSFGGFPTYSYIAILPRTPSLLSLLYFAQKARPLLTHSSPA